MRTNETVRANFPVGARVRTTDPGFLLRRKRQTERFGTVVGYCETADDDGEYVRVRWAEWQEQSNVVVHHGKLEVVR